MRAVLAADRHQSRHLLFSHFDLLAAPVGQADVGDFVGNVLVGQHVSSILMISVL